MTVKEKLVKLKIPETVKECDKMDCKECFYLENYIIKNGIKVGVAEEKFCRTYLRERKDKGLNSVG